MGIRGTASSLMIIMPPAGEAGDIFCETVWRPRVTASLLLCPWPRSGWQLTCRTRVHLPGEAATGRYTQGEDDEDKYLDILKGITGWWLRHYYHYISSTQYELQLSVEVKPNWSILNFAVFVAIPPQSSKTDMIL